MEFKDVVTTYVRMCDAGGPECNCPLKESDCDCDIMSRCYDDSLDELEDIVMRWGKSHPIKTNAMKFKDVFGIEPTRGVDFMLSKNWLEAPYIDTKEKK